MKCNRLHIRKFEVGYTKKEHNYRSGNLSGVMYEISIECVKTLRNSP